MNFNNNTKKYSCKTCANQASDQSGAPACTIHKRLINLETDFCSWHTSPTDAITCPLCGQKRKQKEFYIYLFEDKTLLVCQDCTHHIGTCPTCISQVKCDFANDHSEPQTVTKTIQQGMMMMQTQIKNPKLVMKHCQKCKCSDGADPTIADISCLKEQGGTTCPNWQILPQLLQ